MLKAILQIFLTLIASYFAQLYFPFWSMAIAAAVVAFFFIYKNSLVSFSVGFLAAFLLWSAYAYTLDTENLQLLSGKLGQLFSVSGSYLAYATGLIGSLLGGFGALTGSLARKMFLE